LPATVTVMDEILLPSLLVTSGSWTIDCIFHIVVPVQEKMTKMTYALWVCEPSYLGIPLMIS